MAHYAKVQNGIVVDVTVAEEDFIQTFADAQEWIQTSYNTYGNVHYDPVTGKPDGKPALRGNYAMIGGIYDAVNDVFYPPQPFPSWSINAGTNWVWTAPIPYPEPDGKVYFWDEPTLSWVPMEWKEEEKLTPVEILP